MFLGLDGMEASHKHNQNLSKNRGFNEGCPRLGHPNDIWFDMIFIYMDFCSWSMSIWRTVFGSVRFNPNTKYTSTFRSFRGWGWGDVQFVFFFDQICLLCCQKDQLPSLKLTYYLKMDGWNTSFLLEWPFFRCENVSFRECISIEVS